MESLKLSVLDLSPIYQDVSPEAALFQSVRLAQMAERCGYTRYWVSEHHDMPHLASSCPEVLLAHIAARTTRIRIGSGAVLLPYYQPFKVAEVFHTLAALYPGRVDLGIGRAPGGSAHVTLALGDRFLEKVSRMPELVRDLTSILAHEFSVEGQPVVARPVPEKPPELWLLGTNQKSARYAAEFGTGYVFGQFMSEQDGEAVLSMYREEFQSTASCPRPKVIVAVGVICAETEEEAFHLAREGSAWALGTQNPTAEENDKSTMQRTVVGSPDQVKRQLLKWKHRYQADEFMLVTTIPDYEKRLRSYKLVANAFALDISLNDGVPGKEDLR